MACTICGRGACSSSFHSLAAQEAPEKQAPSDIEVSRALFRLSEAARASIALCEEIGATETNAYAEAVSALRIYEEL